jgi:hypothetical protein
MQVLASHVLGDQNIKLWHTLSLFRFIRNENILHCFYVPCGTATLCLFKLDFVHIGLYIDNALQDLQMDLTFKSMFSRWRFPNYMYTLLFY